MDGGAFLEIPDSPDSPEFAVEKRSFFRDDTLFPPRRDACFFAEELISLRGENGFWIDSLGRLNLFSLVFPGVGVMARDCRKDRVVWIV